MEVLVKGMRFRDRRLESFWSDPVHGSFMQMPMGFRSVLYRKLQMVSAAHSLQDLRVPPSNHLEKLKGDRSGWYSIRVNRQWRLCFRWLDGEAVEVELCDYH